MKKVILEEVGRMREIMGLKPLITEGIGDEILNYVGSMYNRVDDKVNGEAVINNFVKSLKKSDGSSYLDDAGRKIESWPELRKFAAGKNIDEIVPGFSDDLFEYLLKGGDEEVKRQFQLTAVNNVFPEKIMDDFYKWRDMDLPPDASEQLKQDMIALVDGTPNQYIRDAVEDTRIMKQIRGLEARPGERLMNKPLVQTEFKKFKQKVFNKKNYELTEADHKLLDDAVTNGIITTEQRNKYFELEAPGYIKLYRLFEEYTKISRKKNFDKSLSFDKWVEKEIKTKIPSKFDKVLVDTFRYTLSPLLVLTNKSKIYSKKTALTTLAGLGLVGLAGIANDLFETTAGGVEKVKDVTGDMNYAANYQKRWEEYWSSENSPKKKVGNSEESIYSSPDESNTRYSNQSPEIELVDADQNIVKIVDGSKISLNGTEYDTFYFRLAQTVATIGEGKFNPDIIEPFKSKPNQSTVTQQQQTTVTPITDDEKADVVRKLKEMYPTGDYGLGDYPYIKKIADKEFEYETTDGSIVKVTL
jgi:hypothetical protein